MSQEIISSKKLFMNGTQAKKIRQYVRREIFKDFSMLKAKPKWLPRFIYKFIIQKVINWNGVWEKYRVGFMK